MMDLAPAEMAFRVGVFAGVLGMVGWFPPDLRWMAAAVLVVISLVYFYEIWVARGSRRAMRDALVVAVLMLAGAWALVEGWVTVVSTPLLAFAVVCISLWFVGTLGDSGDDTERETRH